MTQAEKQKRVLEYIERGKEIGTKEHTKTETLGISQIKGPLYEAWMSEINVFNERHLKNHPLYSEIHSAFFHHNTNRKCYQNMMGYLQALVNDSEYWQESQQEAIERPAKQSKEEGIKSTMNPIIFISHRTTDAKVADMLKDYLVATGIPNDYIFCSSLPGNDVNSVISREVKENIIDSSINIAILSKNYYESAYCLNEAGIIWLQDPQTPAIIVGLPEISHTNMYGFLNGDYKLRRLDNLSDISAIHDIVHEAVGVTTTKVSIATAAGKKLSDQYKALIDQIKTTEGFVKESEVERTSKLKLMGIDKDGNLSDKFSVYPFALNTENTMNQYIDVIRTMYQEISKMNVGSRDLVSNAHFISLERPVEIDEAERNLIAELAKKLKLELSDNFFDLGNLNEDSFVSDPFSGPTLRGKPEEIQKYEKIKELHDIISKAIEWVPVEQAFSDKYCLRLAVQNCGSAIDEDVEITFEIPQESLLSLTEFPHFENDNMKYLLNDCNMYELFGINSTYEYLDYSDSSKNGGNPVSYPAPTALLGYTPDYKETFYDTLQDIFCYSVYPKKGIYIVKLKLDYIKHNTTVAFPSVLFIKKQFQKIPYKITSKNNPEVFEGVLMVQT